jgi:hypothetical protein
MNKNIRSLLQSLSVILIFYYATVGIVKLLWNTTNEYIFDTRVKFIILLYFTVSIFYVIGIYHIVGHVHVDYYYYAYIFIVIAYLIIGIIANLFIRDN